MQQYDDFTSSLYIMQITMHILWGAWQDTIVFNKDDEKKEPQEKFSSKTVLEGQNIFLEEQMFPLSVYCYVPSMSIIIMRKPS